MAWEIFGGKSSMSNEERQLRDSAEAAVERGLKAMNAVRDAGRALHTLKSRDLWRDTADSWEAYVQQRFSITPRRALQLVDFARFSEAVAEAVGTSGTDVPVTERGLRPLADVPADQVADAIREAVAESGGGVPTPGAIRRAAAKRKKSKAKKAKPPKGRTVRVAGAKITITPTHPEPVFRGWMATLSAALAKLEAESAGDREAA
jgi:hypothetical protein